jgi:hypothetical protein
MGEVLGRPAALLEIIVHHSPLAFFPKTCWESIDNLNIHHRKSLTDYYGETAGNRIWDHFTIRPKQNERAHFILDT